MSFTMHASSTIRALRAAACGALAILSVSIAQAQPVGPQAHAYGRSQPIPGQYIVVFKNDVSNPYAEADDLVRKLIGKRGHVFSQALKGFSAALTVDAVERLRNDPRVDYIEQDRTISLDTTQNSAPWGLDRIDQADRPIDLQYTYNQTGAGVTAFIIDTGIRPDHTEFTGRMLGGFTTVADGRGTNDCNGHGTHVAGTVGGKTYGVAKGVKFVPVRVLNCEGAGTTSGVIAGVDWVANSTARPAVANLSLGGSYSAALNAAIANAVARGVTMVVAAGNENVDACTKSPASEPRAITVGATTNTDARASFSNFGRCVDIFAPGTGITSAWYTGTSATNVLNGTSMASPHVAGVAALALQANPAASPLAITDSVLSNATLNRLTSLGLDSPNRLLYAFATAAPAEPATSTIAISALSGRSLLSAGSWKASATVTVRDIATGRNSASVTVSGSFSPGGNATCVTSSLGQCTLTSASISLSYPSTSFTVRNATGLGMVYNSSQNSASQVVIRR